MTETVSDLDVTDRRHTILVWTTAAGAALMLALGLFIVPTLLSTSSTSDEIARGNELAACRASVEAEVDIVKIESLVASADLELLTNEALSAIYHGDQAELARILDAAPGMRARVQTAVEHARVAQADLQDVATRSREDPDGFLADCKEP